MNKIEKTAEVFKVLSDPTRLKLLRLLSENLLSEITLNHCTPETCTGKGGPLCVNAMANRLGVTQSAVSQHIRILKSVGFVKGERKGNFIHYTIRRDILKTVQNAVNSVLDAKINSI